MVGPDYSKLTVKDLREFVLERGLIPRTWMKYYLKKREAIYLLESNEPLGDKGAELLKRRQEAHTKKVMEAKKNRAEKFGVTKLTPEEMVCRLIRETPNLRYVGLRSFEDGFESATGYRRGKHAIVLSDGNGTELLLTKSEADIACRRAGIKIPLAARRPNTTAKSSNGRPTVRDIFG